MLISWKNHQIFNMTKLKKNTGHAISFYSHITSIVRMPNVRSLGRLLVFMVSNLEFKNSLKLWFSLTMLPFTHSFQRKMLFWSLTFKMQFSWHQRFNWNLWYLNTFDDTHERVRHVIQHIELFANKFNLILMEPWGGDSLYILASTSSNFYFFWYARNFLNIF